MSELSDTAETEESQSKQAELEHLAVEVMLDPGANGFPRYAELYRGLGRAADARRIAEAGLAASPENAAGDLALALALIDLGELGAAKQRLAALLEREAGDYRWTSEPLTPVSALDSAPGDEALGELDDAELDDAFSQAESRPEEMIDANDLAAEAMRIEDLDEPETIFSADALPTFATETMAGVLEAQGDSQGAESIRAALVEEAYELVESESPLTWNDVDAAEPVSESESRASETDATSSLDGGQRERIIATLEGWLENLQRGTA